MVMGLREQKKLETRRQLIDVAGDLFNRLNFEQVTIDDLAIAAGISRKTFFNYFPSKAALLEALIVDWMAQSSLWAREAALLDKVESAFIPPNIDAITNWVISHRRLLQMVDRHTQLLQSGAREFYQQSRKPRLARIIAAQQAGSIRTDVSAELVCQMYDALRLDAVQQWLRLDDDKATEEDFHRYYDAVKLVLSKGFES